MRVRADRLIGWFVERLYRELAWAYDPVSWLVSMGHWRSWARTALPFVRGERVLEVGCGPGHLLRALAKQGKQVWGCDISPAMVRRADRRVRRASLGVPLCQGQAQALPYAEASFDTVVCTFPSRYFFDPRSWEEFARVLAPGGRVVAVYGASLRGSSLAKRLSRWLLSLGRVPGKPVLPPPLEGGGPLRGRLVLVEQGDDRVGILIAEREHGADSG